jgi:hypothetical protein
MEPEESFSCSEDPATGSYPEKDKSAPHYVTIAGHSSRAVWGVGLGRLVAGIVGSNPAQGMDVCPRLSVLCWPV